MAMRMIADQGGEGFRALCSGLALTRRDLGKRKERYALSS